jgi:hypothetical protein
MLPDALRPAPALNAPLVLTLIVLTKKPLEDVFEPLRVGRAARAADLAIDPAAPINIRISAPAAGNAILLFI